MILSFMENYPNRMKLGQKGEKVPTDFIKKIKNGQKIHTIRDTKQNWQVGTKIQVYTGKYAKGGRICHCELTCTGTQDIEIDLTNPLLKSIKVDGKELSFHEIFELVRNDGFGDDATFAWAYFQLWFGNKQKFVGKIIHWTQKRY